jgi:hypothetical protein
VRIGHCKSIGGNGACRSGSNRGDFATVDDTHRSAGVRIEEKDNALVRLLTLRGVVAKDRDELGTEGRLRTKRARHDTEDSPVRERNVRAQELPGFTTRERDHRVAHDRYAALVSEAACDFVAIDETDGRWRGGRHKKLCYRAYVKDKKRVGPVEV